MTVSGARIASLAVVALTGVLFAACAPTPQKVLWENPDVPEAQWSADASACRYAAKREMEREAGLTADRPTGGARLGGGLESYNRAVSDYELQRLQRRLFNDCMRRAGYRPVGAK